MAKKRSNILILIFILFGSSGISFLLNIPIESTIDNSTNIIEGEEPVVLTPSALMDNIVMDGVINDAEWANATHVAKFYLDINNSGTPANLDGYNYMYIGEDTDNLYIGLDLCGDQTGDILDEWISVFLNTNGSTFDGFAEWEQALNNGAESLIHDVQNNQSWTPYHKNIISQRTTNYFQDGEYSVDYGAFEGSASELQSDFDDQYFNITSVQNISRYVTWANFEFNASRLFSRFKEKELEGISHYEMRLQTKNNVSVDSQKLIFWYNNGTYNITDTTHAYNLNNDTLKKYDTCTFYPENSTLNETVKFSIFGNNSANFKHMIDQIYIRVYGNQTNNPTPSIEYPIATIDDNYIINWSFAPSSNNASNHRQFEIKIPKVELEGYNPNGELGVIVGGYGTMSYIDDNKWSYSDSAQRDFLEENSEYYKYFDMDTTDLSGITIDGVVSDQEWNKRSHKAEFYLEVDDDNADANNYLYLAEDYENLYVGVDLCSDITANTEEEWLALWLITNNATFNNDDQWANTLNTGTETLVYSVENNAVWELYNKTEFVLETDQSYEYGFTPVNGTTSGGDSEIRNSIDGNYYNVTSDNWDSTRIDFDLDVGGLFGGMGLERVKLTSGALARFNITLSSFVNTTINSNKLVVWYENGTFNPSDPVQVIDINNGPGQVTENITIGAGNMSQDNKLRFSIVGSHSNTFNHSIDYLRFDLHSYLPRYPDEEYDGTTFPITTVNDFDIKWSFGASDNNATAHRQFEIKIPRYELEKYRKNQDLGIKLGGYGTLSFVGTNWWTFSISGNGLVPQMSNEYLHYDMSDLQNTAPISIDDSGGQNWAWARDQPWCTQGDGSWGNPYIIENLYIDAQGSGSCISVQKSEVYFIVRDCTLINSGNGAGQGGISLFAVNNSMIINNNCSNNGPTGGGSGINIADTSNPAMNNTISGNILNNNAYGVLLYYNAENNTVYNNIINNNTKNGIYVSAHGPDNIIDGNVIANNSQSGIHVFSFGNTTIINNNITRSLVPAYANGIKLDDSDFNLIENNRITDNIEYGIWLTGASGSDNNTILGNVINNNLYDGINLGSGDNNTIESNNLTSNGWSGIDLHDSNDNITIIGNTISFNGDDGIQFTDYVDNLLIINNYIYNNTGNGIDNNVPDPVGWFNEISGNLIYNHQGIGIRIESQGFRNSSIVGNTVFNNTIAMLFEELYNSTVIGNFLYDNNQQGIFLRTKNYNNTIYNNTITNSVWGINVQDSDYNLIMANIIENSWIYDTGINNVWAMNRRNGTYTQLSIDETGAPWGTFTWEEVKMYFPWIGSDGSWADPYVIENLEFEGFQTANVLTINNSKNVYFIIRNCNISGSIGLSSGGIKLINTENGTLDNNNCSFNGGSGIRLENCKNITITNSYAGDNSLAGIYLLGSLNNYIIGNNVSDSPAGSQQDFGIYLTQGCDKNIIRNNFVCWLEQDGISLNDNNDWNQIINNTVDDNGGYGINLIDFNYYNLIFNNSVRDLDSLGGIQARGIRLDGNSDHNNITGNTIEGNQDGINIDEILENITIMDNIILNSIQNGLYFSDSGTNCLIARNTISGSGTNNIKINSGNDNNIFIGNTITGTGISDAGSNNVDAMNKINGVCSSLSINGTGEPFGTFTWEEVEMYVPWIGSDGSWADPYIIENLIINASGNSFGLNISNSAVYFIIRNCKITNSSNGGILFNSVNNSKILSNNCSFNGIGIKFLGDCTNITIYNNTIYNNTQNGMMLDGTKIIIDSNNVRFTTQYSGIYISADECTLINNNVSENGGDGIHNEGGVMNTISDNIVFNNSGHGIYFDTGDNTVKNNVANNNTLHGIFVDSGDNFIIESNNCSNNGQSGISINDGYHSHRIEGNTVSFNTQNGLEVRSGSHNTKILYNFIYNNSMSGIYMKVQGAGGENITIIGNIIHDNEIYGMDILATIYYNLTISDNTIYNHFGDSGILLNFGVNCTISRNIIYNNDYGVNLSQKNNNTLVAGNMMSDSTLISVNIDLANDNNDNRIIGNILDTVISDGGTNTIIAWNIFNWTLSDPVIIDNNGNGNFTWAEARTSLAWVSGSGTQNDPYIISDFEINVSNAGSGITVNNSIVYFTIRNITVYNSSAGVHDAGILLINVQNALLIENNCSVNLGNGILLIQSTNNRIEDNIANNNELNGIFLVDSNTNIIIGNTASFNTQNGVKLQNSDNNQIIDNSESFIGNIICGIHLIVSNSNRMTGNKIGNSNIGIFLDNSNNNEVWSNVITSCTTLIQDNGVGNIINPTTDTTTTTTTEEVDLVPDLGVAGVVGIILLIVFGIVVVFGILYKIRPEEMRRLTDTINRKLRPPKSAIVKPSKFPPVKKKEIAKKPEVKKVVKPVVKPKTEVKKVIKPVVKPTKAVETKPKETPKTEVKKVIKPVVKPKTEVKKVVKPVAKPKTEVKKVVKPVAKPKTEVKKVVKPVAKPKTEVKKVVKPVAKPKTEVKKVVKPVAKPTKPVEAVMDEEALQKKFKIETGKNAIWRGNETKGYLDWKQK